MNTPLTQFTYEGIPALPASEEMPAPPVHPVAPVQPAAQVASPENGIPLFELVARRNTDGSYRNIEMVSILIPGNPKSIPRHKVTDSIRARYRPYYEAWKSGLEMAPVGTPLEMWPPLTPAQVRELKAINVFTVEQLGNISDADLHRIPMGEMLRRQARQWLEEKKNADASAAQVAENQALKDAIGLLEQQNKELDARLTALIDEKVEDKKAVKAAASKDK